MHKHLWIMAACLAAGNAFAATPAEILQGYTAEAKQENAAFKEFSAARGDQLYHAERTHSSGKKISCASCHTADPKNAGKHEKTGKAIDPLAPVANAKRFTDPAKVEKWFKRNCSDVLERTCTAQEKGDFMAYLISVK